MRPLLIPIRSGAQAGVIFDLDGVLVMSEHLWEEAWDAYARLHRSTWLPEDTRRCQGMSVPEWSAYLGERTSRDPADAAEVVIDRVTEAYDSGRVGLADGAADLLAEIAAHVPVGLASSAPRRVIDTALRTTGIGRHFEATVSSAEVARGKPSPDVYLEALRRVRVDARASVAVEDSSNGVRAAAAAGLRVIAVPGDDYPLAADAAAQASAVERSLAGVRRRLAELLDLPSSAVQS